jgi:hypothetical protein
VSYAASTDKKNSNSNPIVITKINMEKNPVIAIMKVAFKNDQPLSFSPST